MPSHTLSTQQVADALGVPYTTLLKWQSSDRLLRPILGAGGRRGGDRWPRKELELARVIVLLRNAGLPVRFIRQVVEALRAYRGRMTEVSAYLVVYAQRCEDGLEPSIAAFNVERGSIQHDPAQLSCL